MEKNNVIPFRRRPTTLAEPPEQLGRYLDQLAAADAAELIKFKDEPRPRDPMLDHFIFESERRFFD